MTSLRAVFPAVVIAGLVAACAGQPASSGAEGGASDASGSIPRLPDGKPDLTGVWGQEGFGDDYGLADLEAAYTPEARAQMEKFVEADDPLFRCLPYGVPRAMLASPWPFQIVHRQGMMVVLTEYYHAFRLIPTAGSPHPPDVLPTYLGDSAGRWEDDTLVVDIIGFNGKTWLADARDRPTPKSLGIWLHSDALHVVERWRLVDADTLECALAVLGLVGSSSTGARIATTARRGPRGTALAPRCPSVVQARRRGRYANCSVDRGGLFGDPLHVHDLKGWRGRRRHQIEILAVPVPADIQTERPHEAVSMANDQSCTDRVEVLHEVNGVHMEVGPGGRQVQIEDPDGNPIELFEPAR
jgi:catechol 2,3-dioxygenase-like lactoylglutathione lyase family enzyme